MRKYAAMFAGVLAAGTVLSGCGGSGDSAKSSGELPELTADRYELDANTPAWKLDQKENTELTWYVNADWWNTEWGNDTVTRKLKEGLHLDVTFITGDDTKLNTFFAGGEMPDIITILDASSSAANSAAKWALPLDTLAEKYDPYFFEVAAPVLFRSGEAAIRRQNTLQSTDHRVR